jgi:oligoendopeptidase F
MTILGDAGVDMTTAAPMEATIDLFESHLDEMERLLAAGREAGKETLR